MSEAYEFIRENAPFFLFTINGDYPAGRPFGGIMEVGDDLYIATNDHNQAYRQLRENGHVQIIAKKQGSMEWVRVTGIATECTDPALRQRMYDESPVLQRHHASADAEHFLMFKIVVENVEMK